VVVLTGKPTLRDPAGTELLAAGEIVCFPTVRPARTS
jgi:hypothetical protein